jgi:hypothetical protein
MGKINVWIPTKEKCHFCECDIHDDKSFSEFSSELLAFVEESNFAIKEPECTVCKKVVSHYPIEIRLTEHKNCPECGNNYVEEYFCSKECAKKYIKDKIDTLKKQKELIAKHPKLTDS